MFSFTLNFHMFYDEQVHAFVAPKIIGGKNAPSPVGELGMVEMSQALELSDVQYEQVRNIYDGFLTIFLSCFEL